jgi:polyhydroxyalkanoate synthesis repressor PhaR
MIKGISTMTIIIKRYQNRKLYNTQSKSYITLEDVEGLIKQGEEIKVIDNQTGNDITAVTLSQVIFEIEKNRSGFIPRSLLLSLVQSGGNKLEEIRNTIFFSLNLYHYYDVEIERRVNALIDAGEMTEAEGSEFLKKMLTVAQPVHDLRLNVEAKINEYLKNLQIPTESDIQMLIDKIDELSQRVDVLNAKE